MKAHPALTEEHEAFRETMRRFVAREIVPHVNDWDEAGEFPREMYRKAAAAGLLGVGFPEEYGGTPADLLMHRRALGGNRARGLGRRAREPLLPPDRLAAGRQRRQRGAEGAGASRGARGREDQRARDHRAGRRIGRRAPAGRARGARATSTSSTARRRSSPRACAPTTTRLQCGPAGRAQPASRCFWSSATGRAFRATR